MHYTAERRYTEEYAKSLFNLKYTATDDDVAEELDDCEVTSPLFKTFSSQNTPDCCDFSTYSGGTLSDYFSSENSYF